MEYTVITPRGCAYQGSDYHIAKQQFDTYAKRGGEVKLFSDGKPLVVKSYDLKEAQIVLILESGTLEQVEGGWAIRGRVSGELEVIRSDQEEPDKFVAEVLQGGEVWIQSTTVPRNCC